MTAVAPTGPSRGTETYTFSSQPRSTAPSSRTKKAPPSAPASKASKQPGNIMYDRRVIRGNTYALHTLPASVQPDAVELQKQEEVRRRAVARMRAREQVRVTSPDAVSGRKHMDIQTELYLEELTDRVEDADNFTQTDAFLDRPPTPLFIPAKTGRDMATQIADGDLFDFGLESKPIVEVLVGKTLEQALLEVLEEEELAGLREQQREFEQKRHAELVETQRLEEQDRRLTKEKERRMQQQREAIIKERETAKKVAARAFAKSYLTDLVPSVFDALTAHGYFYDHVEREITGEFIPWLMGEVRVDLSGTVDARRLLDDVIMHALGLEETSSPEATPTQPAEPSEEPVPPPATEETIPPPTAEETVPPPTTEETVPPPTAEENVPPPTTEETVPPPTAEETVPPPTAEETVPPPTTEETVPPPTAEETVPPPTAEETVPPPATEEKAEVESESQITSEPTVQPSTGEEVTAVPPIVAPEEATTEPPAEEPKTEAAPIPEENEHV